MQEDEIDVDQKVVVNITEPTDPDTSRKARKPSLDSKSGK